jgi:hypothetical protein
VLKTITTAEPSVAPPPLMKHIIKRKQNSDGTWGDWGDTTLCGKLWDRAFLPGSPSCDDCTDVLKRELG